ncbi:5-formyltetrahydrofolate cyclo-ligase [Methylophaga sp.]|uniref:5-formyltetrahydrofolate cyclo-ligase n=1 Tax=Methylophaga sp. TaxID=2024840 RepID=UPI003F699B8F
MTKTKQWKRTQRTQILDERTAISESMRQQIQSRVLERVQRYLKPHPPATLGIYWPIKGEIDCRHISEDLIKAGWRLALPVINNDTKCLDFAEWYPSTEMVKGVWNIPVPVESEWIEPEIFLIPLVGFDEENYRLGYGGGYYDRTLANSKKSVRTIGIGFEQGRLKTIYPHEFDIAMDTIITENGLYEL